MQRPIITALKPRQYLLCLLGLVFLWPAILNGGPFYFDDTTAYVRGADAAVYKITGTASDWTTDSILSNALRDPSRIGHPAQINTLRQQRPVLLGRSIYYGGLLYLGVALITFWPVLVLQALLAVTCLIGLTRHFVDPAEERRFAMAIVCVVCAGAFTQAPFFICFMMPDIFSGLAILAILAIICGWVRERRTARVAWIALLAFAALVHSSNVLLLAGAGMAALLKRIAATPSAHGRSGYAPTLALLAAALTGLTGDAVFTLAVSRMTGSSPIRPPFLTARLIDDGPGTAYLKSHCADDTLLLCHFVERLPSPSDAFLWQRDSTHGVFMTLPPAQQRALASEQQRFVIATVASAPGATVTMMARDFVSQLSKMGLQEFNYSPAQRAFFDQKIPPAVLLQIHKTAAFKANFPIGLYSAIALALTTLSLPILLGSISSIEIFSRWRSYAVVALGGVLLNDVICGCLSTPHDRYQARVIWVLPIIAALILIVAWAERFQGEAPPPS